MSLPFIGFGGLLSLGKESTYGTIVTTNKVLPILSCTLEVTQEPMTLDYLGYESAHLHHNVRETAIVAHDVGGTIETYLCYDTVACGLLLEAMFGANTTTGSGPYTHALVLNTAGVMASMSCRELVGRSTDVAVTNKQRNWTGLVCTSWELMAKAREPVRISLEMLGRVGTALAAVTGTPSVTLGEEVLSHQAGAITWDSTTYVCREIKIKCDHKLERRAVVGSLYTDVPAPSGMQEVEITATIDVIDDAFLVDLLAGTSADMSIAFTGSGNNTLTFTGHNCQLKSSPLPVDKHGVLSAVLTWRCRADGTNRGLRAVLVNDNSALYT